MPLALGSTGAMFWKGLIEGKAADSLVTASMMPDLFQPLITTFEPSSVDM